MKIIQDLDFMFKGNRNYVQGPDIFDKTIRLINENKMDFRSLTMSINKIIGTNLTCILTDEMLSKKEYPVRFDFQGASQNIFYCLLMENEKRIENRNEYKEEEIIALSKIDKTDQSININSRNSYSNIENVVALNKRLLQKLYPHIEGKWYFPKLEIDRKFLEEYDSLKLELVKNMNFKLTKTSILFDNIVVGNIYFSLKK